VTYLLDVNVLVALFDAAHVHHDVSERLRVFCSQPGHVFWSDDVSLRDDTRFDLSRLRGHKQITGLYLAALAARQGGRLATFDTAIPRDALIGGTDDLVEVIPLA